PVIGACIDVQNHVIYQVGQVEEDGKVRVARAVAEVAHKPLIVGAVREVRAGQGKELIPGIEGAGFQFRIMNHVVVLRGTTEVVSRKMLIEVLIQVVNSPVEPV